MTTKWISAGLPVASGTDGQGSVPVGVSHNDGPGAATAQTDFAAFLTDYDTVAAAICVISGDTYSATTHHFTEGGATGLTSAQLHTQMTSLNSALDVFVTANTELAATVTAEAQSSSVLIGYDSALTTNQLKSALRAVLASLGN